MKTAASTIFRVTSLLLFALAPSCMGAESQVNLDDPRSPLYLVRMITLPAVHGRIDHLAVDGEHNHLFVAEYGNGSVDEVDLATGTNVGRINGLREPQGVMWLAKQQEIAVACGDGSVRFYRGSDHSEVARVNLGDDADNMRLDARNGNLVVGYGSGGLAVIDPQAHRILRELQLKAHPEAFALVGSRVFVNLPDAHEIAEGDLDQARVITTLGTGMRAGNYPMAIDPSGTRIAVAYRFPSSLSVFEAASGAPVFSASICGDADDLFFQGSRLVVVCGEGAVELIEQRSEHRKIRLATSRGARTGIVFPERNQLLLGVPGQGDGAAIWELAFR